jgi:hypothetical protein
VYSVVALDLMFAAPSFLDSASVHCQRGAKESPFIFDPQFMPSKGEVGGRIRVLVCCH